MQEIEHAHLKQRGLAAVHKPRISESTTPKRPRLSREQNNNCKLIRTQSTALTRDVQRSCLQLSRYDPSAEIRKSHYTTRNTLLERMHCFVASLSGPKENAIDASDFPGMRGCSRWPFDTMHCAFISQRPSRRWPSKSPPPARTRHLLCRHLRTALFKPCHNAWECGSCQHFRQHRCQVARRLKETCKPLPSMPHTRRLFSASASASHPTHASCREVLYATT
jgi:hypothetical protein